MRTSVLLAGVASVLPVTALRAWSSAPLHVQKHQKGGLGSVSTLAADPEAAAAYPVHKLRVPIDHFHNDSLYEPHKCGKFDLQYWYDAQYYKPGGPVSTCFGVENFPFRQHLKEAKTYSNC